MSDETGKGRATPSRKDAEAARRQAMKQTLTRKEQAKREREARTSVRQKQQAALRGQGSDSYLPPRDRGPVRKFVRDYVDRRINIAEFSLPIILLIFAASLIQSPQTVAFLSFVYPVVLLLLLADGFRLSRGLKKELKVRFPDSPTPGTTFYAILRTFQLRRIRLPKPAVNRGEALPDRY